MNQKTKRARGARHAGAGNHAKPPSPFTPEERALLDAAKRSMGFSDRLDYRLADEQEAEKEAHAFDEAQEAQAHVQQAAAEAFDSEDAQTVAHVAEDDRVPAYVAAQPFSAETKETAMTKFQQAMIAVVVVVLLGTAWAYRYETVRLNSRGWVLLINRWTGQKYVVHPSLDSAGVTWIVSPVESPATPPAPAPDASSGH